MKRIIISFLLFSFSFHLFGQIGNQNGSPLTNGSNIGFLRSDHLPDSFLKSDGKTFKYNDINGSPYIDNRQELKYEIPIGKLYTSKFKLVNTLFLRYNAFTDNMELSTIDDGIDYYILKKKSNSWYIVLGENKYRAYEFSSNGQNQIGFFSIVSEKDTNQYSLLKKEKIIFKNEVKEKNGFLSSFPAEFRRIKDTYFVKIKERVIRIPKKKKDFFNLFSTKQNELKKFINKNKLKITREKDLFEIINYYNSFFGQ